MCQNEGGIDGERRGKHLLNVYLAEQVNSVLYAPPEKTTAEENYTNH